MLELRIIKALGSVYRAAIRLGLYSVNERDKRALRTLDKNTSRAYRMEEAAAALKVRASALSDEAHVDYANKARQVSATYHVLRNALDDARIEV